jgi:hypothetical protein
MLTASYLLEFRYTLLELAKANTIRQNGEPKIDFFGAYSTDAPLCVMVPERFVPVVEWFGCEKVGGLGSWPIPPKQLVDTIEAELGSAYTDRSPDGSAFCRMAWHCESVIEAVRGWCRKESPNCL